MTTNTNNFRLGPISSGTLNPAHLIPAFLDELARLGREVTLGPSEQAALRLLSKQAAIRVLYESDLPLPDRDLTDQEWQTVYELTDRLWDALDDAAPDGYWFGTAEGDGACFGFWTVEEEEEA